MTSNISEELGYLLVRISGTVTFPELFSLQIAVMENASYHCTNDLWYFADCYFSFSADQLPSMVHSILSIYPKGATRSKTAIVVSSGLAEGMAMIWKQMAVALPYETKTFQSLLEAEEWIRA